MGYRIHRLAPIAAAGYDTDAQAFFTAAGISDSTQKSAVNQLVLDLKSASIWTKMVAIYPFVGGTSTTHKYNLKDPRDLDAAFRLVYTGTITHDANGITPNGTTGFADTKYVDSTSGTLDSLHFSLYSRTAAGSNTFEMGAGDASTRQARMRIRGTGNTTSSLCQNGTADAISNSDASGLFVMSRTASTGYRFQIRGTNNDITRTSVNTALSSVYIGALNNNGTASSFSAKNIAFASIGAGLTQTEAGNLDTAVVAFQTTLSRNV